MMAQFNHNLLVLAREARGLTQSELADSMSIMQGTLSKYETGLKEPPSDTIEKLSMSLGFPVSFFFCADHVYGFPPYHYRKRKKLSAKLLGRIVAEMNIRRMHIQRLCLSYGNGRNGFIPEIDRDEYVDLWKKPFNVEDAARTLREMWMLPRGPIANMTEILEANGAVVVPCDFGTDLIDAMSQRVDGMPTLIFVNVNVPADRLRHTLAHELAHMVLHTTIMADDDKMEEEADSFAGAFLLPADEVKAQLRHFDLRQLVNMKMYWKISMAAIAVRADRLQLITPYQKKMFWMEMGRLGYRKREPYEPEREEPRRLREMVAFHQKKLGYSTAEMAKLLNLTVHDFQRMYSPELIGAPPLGPRLRLVK
jgi:Zn-dependent peptidase ImmA (M78 family)